MKKRKKKRLLFAGTAVTLVLFTAALVFFIRAQPDPGRRTETTTQDKEENHENHSEIPESTEDEPVPKSRLSITDPEGELKAAAKMKELKKSLRRFLRSEQEGRRNFYVDSVTVTEDGYQALLCFETVRQDGRNVEVTYDGDYHFRFE